jgi:hypothetical protein
MVDIAGRFCIDRYEATLVDGSSGHVFSPYYSPSPQAARQAYQKWSGRGRPPGLFGLNVPALPDWQLEPNLVPLAVSKPGVIPQGYMSGAQAAAACAAANKRLCTAEEWELACRGQRGSKFPYGDHYESGACNVCRPAHPALILHGDASVGHRDPRLNMVEHQGERLLRPTGSTPRCKSVWGNDGVYDMVGNLDEWLDDPDGLFAGGFFSRGTKAGCQARVSVHPPQYFDYSLGVRCCR